MFHLLTFVLLCLFIVADVLLLVLSTFLLIVALIGTDAWSPSDTHTKNSRRG